MWFSLKSIENTNSKKFYQCDILWAFHVWVLWIKFFPLPMIVVTGSKTTLITTTFQIYNWILLLSALLLESFGFISNNFVLPFGYPQLLKGCPLAPLLIYYFLWIYSNSFDYHIFNISLLYLQILMIHYFDFFIYIIAKGIFCKVWVIVLCVSISHVFFIKRIVIKRTCIYQHLTKIKGINIFSKL